MENNREQEFLQVLRQIAAKVGTSSGGALGGAHTHGGLAPTGGTVNQVLTKLSSADYDYTWQTPSGGGGSLLHSVPWRVPASYRSLIVSVAASGTGGWSAGGIRAYPFKVEVADTFDRIWSACSALQAGATHRMAIYNSDATTGYPTTLVANTDVEAYDDSTTGVKEGTFSSAVTLAAGWYWAAWMTSTGTNLTLRSYTAVSTSVLFMGNSSNSNVSEFNHILATQTYGAMPATFPAGATPQTSTILKILLRYPEVIES